MNGQSYVNPKHLQAARSEQHFQEPKWVANHVRLGQLVIPGDANLIRLSGRGQLSFGLAQASAIAAPGENLAKVGSGGADRGRAAGTTSRAIATIGRQKRAGVE